jgi:predicted nucleic acid-binding protein
MIHAWDHYPYHIKQFQNFWEWMGEQIISKQVVISEVAFNELTKPSKECKDWLKEKAIQIIPTSNEIRVAASKIKLLLGIENDNYHSDGVGEKDIFIIATAQYHDLSLVSNEEKQSSLPTNIRKYKIPAVCKLAEVAVPCVDFREYINKAGDIQVRS